MPNTINVTIRAIDQNGQPLAHAPISARLTNLEVTQNLGYVVQESNAVIADANGVAVMALWPNALGSTESSYKFTIRNPNNWQIETIIATLPNNDCELHNVADLPAYPGKTDGQLAIEEAIAAVAPALAAKTAAEAAAIEAGLSATEAAENAAITSNFNITIGTVTEGNAAATITGTTPNRVLNLVIPKGVKGDTGLQGIQGTAGINGINGLNGSDGADGVDGLDGKSAYQLAVDSGFVGTLNQWILSLKGDKGDKGDTGNTGLTGGTGLTGAEGKSAYQVALDNGFVGTLSAWLASLVGPQGPQGIQGIQGIPGNNGTNGVDGTSFTVDATGLLANRSAYDSEAAGFAYLATDTGNLYIRQGASGWSAAIPFGKGETGAQGIQGPAGLDGADGTNGTNGVDGADGLSAYQIAVNAGFVGNEAAWLLSLKGETGAAGINGINGTNGTDGVDGIDGTNGINGTNGLSAYQIAVNNGFVGNEAAWLASLEGPAGPAGADGIDGADGAPGTTTWAGITDKPTFAAVATSGLKSDVGLGNVENKSAATILGELTAGQVAAALTYTPLANTYVPTWSSVTGKPTTLAGYGITDAASSGHNHTGVYQPIDADLTAIAALAGTSGLLKKTAADTWTLDTNTYLTSVPAQAWSSITDKPTTLAGYGITDALSNTYVPTWASITGKPAFATVATSGDYADLINKPAAYTLPVATNLVLGGVKPDGTTILNTAGVISTSAAAIGLGNVNNTSDADKPVSTATQTALNAKQDTLVSGTSIKTVNGNSLLGAGNIAITGPATTDDLPEGSTKLYFTAARVLASVLTGLSTATGGAVVATDTVLAAFGRVQNSLNSLASSLAGKQDTSAKDASGGYAGLTLFKINFRNAANSITSFFTNANTVARTYTFQNRDGTIADNTDLALKANLVSPSFTTPTLGVATATTINKITFTAPASSATFTLANGKTFTVSNTLTLVASDTATLNIGTGGTLGTAAFSDASAYAPSSGSANYLAPAAIGTTVQAYDADLTTWAGKTAPTGTVVGTTDTQVLTGKSLQGAKEVSATLSGTTPVIGVSNGTLLTWALTGNSTPTTTLADGEYVHLKISDGTAYTITWTSVGVVWKDGTAPTLATTGFTEIALWKQGTVIHGAKVGDFAS